MGEGVKKTKKNNYFRFVTILRGPKIFLKKCNFLAKRVKTVFKNAIKKIGGGRVPFNKNFMEGRGYF
jgi:hypothetical protein